LFILADQQFVDGTATPAEAFSYPAASAVAQLKSKWALRPFITMIADRTKAICTNVLVVKTLLNSVMPCSVSARIMKQSGLFKKDRRKCWRGLISG
jgi:hypothetical protein